MLDSKVGRRIASLNQKQLFAELINDAYKPKMHKIYYQFLRGAKVDFALNIRKSPFELKKIEKELCKQPAQRGCKLAYSAVQNSVILIEESLHSSMLPRASCNNIL